MIQDEKLWNSLYNAAEELYKQWIPGQGFYSGTIKDKDGSFRKIYNQFDGAKGVIETKLKRKLTLHEQAVLAIAVGDRRPIGLKKVLTIADINVIFTDLWDNQPNSNHDCIPFDRLVTNI